MIEKDPELFYLVRSVINNWDPINILFTVDEYDPEVGNIAYLLKKNLRCPSTIWRRKFMRFSQGGSTTESFNTQKKAACLLREKYLNQLAKKKIYKNAFRMSAL